MKKISEKNKKQNFDVDSESGEEITSPSPIKVIYRGLITSLILGLIVLGTLVKVTCFNGAAPKKTKDLGAEPTPRTNEATNMYNVMQEKVR